MDAKVFIEKVNNGDRRFNDTVIDGIVDLDQINCGPEESIVVAAITVESYNPNKHVEISAGNFRVLGECKIPY